MLPSSLITVLAPHWTGRFRRYKRDVEKQDAGQQVNERDKAARLEANSNENENKQHQITVNRDMRSQKFMANPTEQVQDRGLLYESGPQEKPTSSGQSKAGWLHESSLSSWTPHTAATSLLSTSISSDTSRVKLDNRKKVTADTITSPVHSSTAHSGSLDFCYYRRTSLVKPQNPPQAQVSKSSSPSSRLLSLRRVSVLHGNNETHSPCASTLFSETQSSSTALTPTEPKGPKSSSCIRDCRLQCGHVEESPLLYCLNNQSLPLATSLNPSFLKENAQLDDTALTSKESSLLGHTGFCPVLSGLNHNVNHAITNNSNNDISSVSTRHNYGGFSRSTNHALQVPDTYSSYILTSSPTNNSFGSQNSLNTPTSLSNFSRITPIYQPFAPVQTWGRKERALSTSVSPLRRESYSFEGTDPTHACNESLVNCSSTAQNNKFQKSSSPTSLPSFTSQRQSPRTVYSSIIDSSMVMSSPVLSTKSPQRMDNARIQNENPLLKSSGKASHSLESPDTNFQRSERSPSSTAPMTSAKNIQITTPNTGDVSSTDSMSLLNCPVVQTRPVHSVDAPMTYSSLRCSSPSKAIPPIQMSISPDLQDEKIHVSSSLPSPEGRLRSWRQHYFHGKKQVWFPADFNEEQDTKIFHMLSSTPSDSTRTPYSSKPLTPTQFLEQQHSQKSLDNESKPVPMDSTGHSSTRFQPNSFLTNSRNKSFPEGMEKLSAQENPFTVPQRQMATEGKKYVPWKTAKSNSLIADLSRWPSQQQTSDLNSPETKGTKGLSSRNCESTTTVLSADTINNFIQLCDSNPVLQATESSTVISLDVLRSPSATSHVKSQEITEKVSAKDYCPVVESPVVCLQDHNLKRSLSTIKSTKDQSSLFSSVVTTKPPTLYSKTTTAGSAGNKSGSKVDVFLNRIRMTFSSKWSEEDVLRSRKKSKREAPFSHSRRSGVAMSDDTPYVNPSDYENKTESNFNDLQYSHAQMLCPTAKNPQPESMPFEAHNLDSGLHNRTDANGNHSELRSEWIPVKQQSFSSDHYSISTGPRKSSISTSQFHFDLDLEDEDSENVFYCKGSLERQSKKNIADIGQISVSRQLSEDDYIRKLSQSRSCNSTHHEGQLYSSSSSDFSLKGGRSFSVSSVHASRPSGSARMAIIPRMTSVDNLADVCILGDTLGQRSRVLSCSLDQTASRNCSWDLVTTDHFWSRQSLKSFCSLQDEELSPPPSPFYSPRPVSRPPSFSPVGSLMSQDSLSPRGRLPSKGYKSSLSAFEESDSDTTTDDEYYLGTDKGERETEL
ncbi:mucin-4 [Scleropages formosus]|uniref:mucin-4 n=1 Tax=Scleropages formosus TaxID=113540 RepID=UPI00087817E0|nr:mucin-4-like [Scleropages formosus]XP_018616814.1 mucin-4-like [Scleropages formosus]XP_018616815.1 mucin-4-like [Scleropages formosus]